MKTNSIRLFLFFTTVTFAVGCSVFKPKNLNEPPHDFNKEFVIENKPNPFFKASDAQKKWVDSVYNSLTLEEKIGQLFMIAAYSNKDSVHIKSIDKLIQNNKIGGLIFMQ